MFVKDGICYADNQAPQLKVGETKLFDTTILTGEVFEPLKNPDIINNPKISHGVITWKDEEIDVAPEYVYENAFPYNTENVICADTSPDFNK